MIIIDLKPNENLVYDPLEFKPLFIGCYIAILIIR